MYKAATLAALVAANEDKSNHWALLVAGSRTYSNYRHQSDTCHAYQIMKANGIPEDQIIHVAYDDIANNVRNPFKGKIFNKPTAAGTPGVDVYDGCKIDYKGDDATAATVLAILQGDESIGGPVLKSDSNSKVFFYFADHGAPGLVAMPVGKYLYAKDMNAAFETMHKNNMYDQMSVYMESCESGSMFENLLADDINIYALSASNASSSSWAAYCSPQDKVDGKSVGSCLGDLFSINWMEDTDAAVAAGSMDTETLQEQFETVKAKTTRSPVLQWGELDWTTEPIGIFEGHWDTASDDFFKNMMHGAGKTLKQISDDFIVDAVSSETNKFAIDSRDVNLHYYYNLVMNEPSAENQQALLNEIEMRMNIDKIFNTLNPNFVLGEHPSNIDFECYQELIESYEATCGSFNEYSMKYMGQLAHECAAMEFFPDHKDNMKARFGEVC